MTVDDGDGAVDHGDYGDDHDDDGDGGGDHGDYGDDGPGDYGYWCFKVIIDDCYSQSDLTQLF